MSVEMFRAAPVGNTQLDPKSFGHGYGGAMTCFLTGRSSESGLNGEFSSRHRRPRSLSAGVRESGAGMPSSRW